MVEGFGPTVGRYSSRALCDGSTRRRESSYEFSPSRHGWCSLIAFLRLILQTSGTRMMGLKLMPQHFSSRIRLHVRCGEVVLSRLNMSVRGCACSYLPTVLDGHDPLNSRLFSETTISISPTSPTAFPPLLLQNTSTRRRSLEGAP